MKTQEATTTTTTKKKPAKAKSTAAKSAGKPALKEAAAKAAKAPKTTKAKPKATKGTGSKTEIILDLLRRKDGASVAEIAAATGWQNHSIRGFISGQVTKKMKLKVESTKSDAGERTYRFVT